MRLFSILRKIKIQRIIITYNAHLMQKHKIYPRIYENIMLHNSMRTQTALGLVQCYAFFSFNLQIVRNSYRFEVYTVDKCPMNRIEFEEAKMKINCSQDTRYLCAPDRNLSSLIEFCTDVRRSLFGPGISCLVYFILVLYGIKFYS